MDKVKIFCLSDTQKSFLIERFFMKQLDLVSEEFPDLTYENFEEIISTYLERGDSLRLIAGEFRRTKRQIDV